LNLEANVRSLVGIYDSEETLIRDNNNFWRNTEHQSFKSNSHWRGHGPFEDDDLWLSVGEMHRILFQRAADWAGMVPPIVRMVEWGCGGGMNAVSFAQNSRHYFGVDISAESLAEAEKQIQAFPQCHFVPVGITADNPEAALGQIDQSCDAFVCTYVFEVLPTAEYGTRILKIAFELLRPGGIALIQIRYHGATARLRSRRWDYHRNMEFMLTYGIDEFWQVCSQIGFEPIFISLLPPPPELGRRYAYYAMRKPSSTLR